MNSTFELLHTVTTGTITKMLLKKGIRRSWMAGAMPLGISGKLVGGQACTLRLVPARQGLRTPARRHAARPSSGLPPGTSLGATRVPRSSRRRRRGCLGAIPSKSYGFASRARAGVSEPSA